MSYVARNHPQQVGKRGALPSVDDRAIPQAEFDKINERFHFTVDACATPENARLERYWTVHDNSLAWDFSWERERVWCNPPHSNLGPWVDKAWGAWQGTYHTDVARLIVMLVPANRTEQKWWQEFVEPNRDRRQHLSVEFLPGRMRFIAPGQTEVGPNERPPYGCCLLVWGGS